MGSEKKKLRQHWSTIHHRASTAASRQHIRRLHRAHERVRSAGAALLLALIAAGVMIGLAVALSARSFGGLLASVFGGDAEQAKEAAELGAARIQAALMQEQNRGLLPLAPAGSVSWSSAQIARGTNPCAVNASRPYSADLAVIASGGATGTSSISVGSGNAAPVVYINNNGTASVSSNSTPAATAPANTRYAYQLASIEVPTAASWTNKSGSPTGTPTRGQLRLRVKGYSYNSAGALSGSTVLEKTLEVVPKCCSLSLGGNNNTGIGNDNRNCNSQINNPGFGLLFGTDLTGDGSLSLTGVKSSVESLADGKAVNPLICRSSTTSTCPIEADVGTGETPVVSNEFNINDPEQYLDSKIAAPSNPTAQPWDITSTKCGNNITPASGNFFRSYTAGGKLVCEVNPGNTTGLPPECGVKINDNVTEISSNGTKTVRTFQTVHCNILSLQNGNNEIWRFVTSDSARLVLHFPAEDKSVINIIGTADHCDFTSSTSTSCTDSPSVTSNPLLRLNLLGCINPPDGQGCADNTATGASPNSANKTDSQGITLTGNSTLLGLPYFLYFPIADLVVSGGGGTTTASVAGVFWVNTIKGSGNVEIAVPGSGIGDLLNQYTGSTGSGSDDEGEEATAAPPFLEYTLRAVQKFFFSPGT